jgi:hypothetical protein
MQLTDILRSGGREGDAWVPVLGPQPTPKPVPTPKPAPTPKPPGGCDVDACFARCVAKYGGTVADKSYECAKGCAGMSGGKVSNKGKYCKVEPANRYPTCVESVQHCSSDAEKQAEYAYGCVYWVQTRMMTARQLKNEDGDSIVEAESASMSKIAFFRLKVPP